MTFIVLIQVVSKKLAQLLTDLNFCYSRYRAGLDGYVVGIVKLNDYTLQKISFGTYLEFNLTMHILYSQCHVNHA